MIDRGLISSAKTSLQKETVARGEVLGYAVKVEEDAAIHFSHPAPCVQPPLAGAQGKTIAVCGMNVP